MGGEQAEEAEAESFAGELARGLNGEVGSGAGGGEAVGMKDPERQDGALVPAALEIASEEGGDIVEHFLGPGGFGLVKDWRLRFWRSDG